VSIVSRRDFCSFSHINTLLRNMLNLLLTDNSLPKHFACSSPAAS